MTSRQPGIFPRGSPLAPPCCEAGTPWRRNGSFGRIWSATGAMAAPCSDCQPLLPRKTGRTTPSSCGGSSKPPGGTIASEARWAESPLAGAVTWYFAGVSGQTVHVFVIFQEFSKTAARIIEIERRPVLLTLDKDDVATLTLLPLHAKPAVLKLKRNGDESLTVSGPPK